MGVSQNRRSLALRWPLAAALGALPALGTATDDEAMKLALAVFERPNGRDLTTVSRMELAERGKPPRVRQMITYRMDRGRGETANLVRFVAPKDVAGTGLLSIDRPDGSGDQWLYLPALDRVRRVSSERKGGRFVGSDLYLEDLQERHPKRDLHQIVGTETLDGVACSIVQSMPRDAADSVYQKRLSWIDPATALILRVDYFERDASRPSKRWLLGSKQKSKSYWIVTDSRVTDLVGNHETRMIVETAMHDRKLPAKLFTQQMLGDPDLEAEFRP